MKVGAVITAMLFLFPAVAHATKPQPPVSVKCTTTSNRDFVYTAECVVKVSGTHKPLGVQLSTMQDKGTKVASYKSENPNGIGKWTIIFEARDKKPYPVLFEARYKEGMKFRAVGIYDPYNVINKAPKKAAGKQGKKAAPASAGAPVKEIPSR